eukprot:tig00000411_g548.t1
MSQWIGDSVPPGEARTRHRTVRWGRTRDAEAAEGHRHAGPAHAVVGSTDVKEEQVDRFRELFRIFK